MTRQPIASYIPVTNIKLATALASFGVPLVPPTVTRSRVKNRKTGQVMDVVGYFFAQESLSGLSTIKLIEAWDYPDRFHVAATKEPYNQEPYTLIPLLRAVLDNNDAWRQATIKLRDVMAKYSVGNPDAEECENQLREAAKVVVPKIVQRRGKSFSILRADAPPEEVKAIAELLRKVAK